MFGAVCPARASAELGGGGRYDHLMRRFGRTAASPGFPLLDVDRVFRFIGSGWSGIGAAREHSTNADVRSERSCGSTTEAANMKSLPPWISLFKIAAAKHRGRTIGARRDPVDNTAMAKAMEVLTDQEAPTAHRKIYQAMLELSDRGRSHRPDHADGGLWKGRSELMVGGSAVWRTGASRSGRLRIFATTAKLCAIRRCCGG